MNKDRKKPPLRIEQLVELRESGGLSCPGRLMWDEERGMLRSSIVNGKRVYTYTCPNCHHQGSTEKEKYRAKCGRKLT